MTNKLLKIVNLKKLCMTQEQICNFRQDVLFPESVCQFNQNVSACSFNQPLVCTNNVKFTFDFRSMAVPACQIINYSINCYQLFPRYYFIEAVSTFIFKI